MDILTSAHNTYLNIHARASTNHITFQKEPITQQFREKLKKELQDKWFIQASLEKLLQQEHYITMTLSNITISYIPTRKLPRWRMERIMCRLHTVSQVLSASAPIRIWFIPCKEKKRFPEPSQPISYQHMNGGYTYTEDHTIYVYRMEEFPKVFVHEVIHNTKINTESWNVKDLAKLYQQFQIDTAGCPNDCQTDLRPNEAVVEVWALLFQLIFVSIDTQEPFQALLQDELYFSLYQTQCILQHQRSLTPWKESTHSYSYIVFKTIFLLHIHEFLAFSIPYSSHKLIRFLLTHKGIPLPPPSYKVPKNLKGSLRMTVYGDR